MAAPLTSVREIEREVATLRLAPGEDMPYQRTSVMTHTAWVPPEWVEAAEDVLAGLARAAPVADDRPRPRARRRGRARGRGRRRRLPGGRRPRRSAPRRSTSTSRASAPRRPRASCSRSSCPICPCSCAGAACPAFGRPRSGASSTSSTGSSSTARSGRTCRRSYGPLADVFDRVVVSDIAWARTSRWRRQLASLWPGIADVKTIRVSGHRRPGAAARRLAAFAARP